LQKNAIELTVKMLKMVKVFQNQANNQKKWRLPFTAPREKVKNGSEYYSSRSQPVNSPNLE